MELAKDETRPCREFVALYLSRLLARSFGRHVARIFGRGTEGSGKREPSAMARGWGWHEHTLVRRLQLRLSPEDPSEPFVAVFG